MKRVDTTEMETDALSSNSSQLHYTSVQELMLDMMSHSFPVKRIDNLI